MMKANIRLLLPFLLSLSLFTPLAYSQDPWTLQGNGQYDLALAESERLVENGKRRLSLPRGDPESLADSTYAKRLSEAGLINQLNGHWEKAIRFNKESIDIWSKYVRVSNKAYVNYLALMNRTAICHFYLNQRAETIRIADEIARIGVRYSVNYRDRQYVDFVPYKEFPPKT